MYGAEHNYLIHNKQRENKPMMGYGQIADYHNKLKEAEKHNKEFNKSATDFFKVRQPAPKANTEEIEMVEINKNEIRQHVLQK